MLDFQKLSADYQQALLRQVVPFWLKNSRDSLCGGYFDMLSATGDVIEGDKSVAAQAQQVWAFAWLYNTFDGQPAWLDHARHGGNLLSQFAHTETLDCYSQLDRRGRPLSPATSTIPASTTVMAYAQLHRATGEDEWAMLAKQVFGQLLEQRDKSRAQQQEIGGYRQVRHLSEATQLLKAVLDMQPLLDEEAGKAVADMALQEIIAEFLDRRTNILREYILPEGGFINTPEGRRLNVGLTFQTAGYLLDLCAENGDRKMTMQVVTWCLHLCEQAWDEAMGGLNQYIDVKGQVSIFPDAQQKWAWVHVEAISCLVKGYFQTRHPDCSKWFKRIHTYTFQHFPDAKQNGWHLALDQQQLPLLSAKSIPETGCFSLIKCLAETAKTLIKCGQLQPLARNVRVI
ncbi:AGE family epimerase/isomerase [Spirosoma utsteinense]|uniref:N-acylglucosamine 2-epimerase n=1 Tax=Spirosoma utsteinense TaxID=2585773 RepID=A0ABR6W0Z0_9BACT|nr:AGE family epimerase/isomerase [Spirosoma utsteinense]MBC3785109.1 N-acylglucosamine 2-epimerase [Spirosoma utsteinense]MBC3790281.1 N-acylglucosamine 2-epimerase [Spirosoma utsteinense]